VEDIWQRIRKTAFHYNTDYIDYRWISGRHGITVAGFLMLPCLEGYYTRYKQEVLENGFQQINAASEQGILNTSDMI